MADLTQKAKAELAELIDGRDAVIADLEERIADRDARLKEWTDDPEASASNLIEIEVLNGPLMLAISALIGALVAFLHVFRSAR